MTNKYRIALDIGFRLLMLDPKDKYWDVSTRSYITDSTPRWLSNSRSYGGERGVFSDIENAKNSARAHAVKKGTYEIWKFHMGLPTSEVPWFPPEKVYG